MASPPCGFFFSPFDLGREDCRRRRGLTGLTPRCSYFISNSPFFNFMFRLSLDRPTLPPLTHGVSYGKGTLLQTRPAFFSAFFLGGFALLCGASMVLLE